MREIGDVEDGDDQDEDGVSEAPDSGGGGDIAADAHDSGEWLDDSVEDGDVLPAVQGDDAKALSGCRRGGGRK